MSKGAPEGQRNTSRDWERGLEGEEKEHKAKDNAGRDDLSNEALKFADDVIQRFVLTDEGRSPFTRNE